MNYPATLDTIITFGTHKGKTIEYLCDEHPDYIDWCMENIKEFELDNEAYAYWEAEFEQFENDK